MKINVRCMMLLAGALLVHSTAMFVPPSDEHHPWNLAQRLKSTSYGRPQGDYGFTTAGVKQAITDQMVLRGREDFKINKKNGFPNGAATGKAELMRYLRNMLENQDGVGEIIIPGDRVALFGKSGQHMGVVERVWTNQAKGKWGAPGTLWRRVKLDDPSYNQKGHAWARQVFNSNGEEKKIYRLQKAEDTGVLPEEGDDAEEEVGPDDASEAMSVASTRAAERLDQARRMMDVMDPVAEDGELDDSELLIENALEVAGPAHGVKRKDRQEYAVRDLVTILGHDLHLPALAPNKGYFGRTLDPAFYEVSVASGEQGKIKAIDQELQALVAFPAGDRWLRPADISDATRVCIEKGPEPWSCTSCKRRKHD